MFNKISELSTRLREKHASWRLLVNILFFLASLGSFQAQAVTIFNNVLDFEGQSFKHISFDPPDERNTADIVAKFTDLTSFTISGGEAAIRHTSQHYVNFSGEGSEGGPVSGEYRIDWGYFAPSTIELVFNTPVDAVGAFFGGDAGRNQAIVTV